MCLCVILPAEHLRVVVDRDVGFRLVVIRAKVAVWWTKPFIKTVLQRKILWSVAQVPIATNKVHSHTKISVAEAQPICFCVFTLSYKIRYSCPDIYFLKAYSFFLFGCKYSSSQYVDKFSNFRGLKLDTVHLLYWLTKYDGGIKKTLFSS